MAVFRKYLFRSVLLWVGLFFALISLPMLLIGAGHALEAAELRRDGRIVEGTVLEAHFAGSNAGSLLRRVRFYFTDAGGNAQSQEAIVRTDPKREIRAGDTVRVLHLPDRPWISKLPDIEVNSREGWGAIWSGGGFLAVALLAYAGARRRAARAARLFRGGVLADGQVTAVEPDLRTTINGRHPKFLRFTFTAVEDGKTHVGKSQNVPFRDEGQWRVGRPVTIAYNPSKPEEHEADIFGFTAGRRA